MARLILAISVMSLSTAALAEEVLREISWSRQSEDGLLPNGDEAACHVEEDVLRIETADGQAATVGVLTLKDPAITTAKYAIVGEVRYDAVEGEGYLEMWGNKFSHLPVMACSYRTSCFLILIKAEYKVLPKRKRGKPLGIHRQLSFMPGSEGDAMEYDRGDLCFGDTITGPAIIREPVATTMVCMGQVAEIGQYGEICIERR